MFKGLVLCFDVACAVSFLNADILEVEESVALKWESNNIFYFILAV